MLTFMDGESDGRSVILVALDFSETSRRALDVARDLTKGQPNPELHVVHVLPPVRGPIGPGELASAGEVELLRDLDHASNELGAVCAAAQQGIDARVEGHVRIGDPDREIVQLASDIAADLVVVGTHGRTGIARALLGSVAEQVVRRAPCAVLTVKPKQLAAWAKIEPPCPECVKVQRETKGERLWCERHSERHPRARLHYAYPQAYGIGSMSFRSE